MKKERSFSTDDILKEITKQTQKGVEVTAEVLAGKISVKDTAYLRSWADSKGLFVNKVGESIYVTNAKKSTLRGYIMAGISTGKVSFSVTNAKERTVRFFVSRHNAKNKENRWCVMKKGPEEFLIYPEPSVVAGQLV